MISKNLLIPQLKPKQRVGKLKLNITKFGDVKMYLKIEEKEDAIKARIDAEKSYFKEFKSKILNNEIN